jgi:ubiquinone/menaquinone biosynthesis C-methylase UbiE
LGNPSTIGTCGKLPDDFAAKGWILDLGGGCRGTIGRMKPDQVVAIDISPRELKEAPTNFLKIIMDASDLKFLDGTFNTETAFFSLMYMPPEQHRKIFSETYRVLKPGGRWLIWDEAEGVREELAQMSLTEPTGASSLIRRFPIERVDFLG